MSTGIKIKGGGEHFLGWNLSVGTDTGIDVEDSWKNILQGNIHVSSNAIEIYGKEIIDVAKAVQESKDVEALLALGDILNSKPDNSILGWVTLIKKFGKKIGNFSVDILKGIISEGAYSLLMKTLGVSI